MQNAHRVRFNKKEVEKLVEENSKSIKFGKPNKKTKASTSWSQFSRIYVDNVKQDYVICDTCKTVLIYKPETGSGCMLHRSRSCPSKHKDVDSPLQQVKLNQYYESTIKRNIVPKHVKDILTTAIAEFVAQDGRAFQLIKGSGFIAFAAQLLNSGKLLSSSADVQIEDILPDPTTVSNFIFYQSTEIYVNDEYIFL